jgi:hypothetical protein
MHGDSVRPVASAGVGAWRVMTGTPEPVPPPSDPVHGGMGSGLTLFLLLTAFSNGCTAMTGVEAVSNGVPAFKPPEPKNAAATLVTMACLSITMFLGITLLSQTYGVIPSESETVVSRLARGVFEGRGFAYYAVQAATMLILVLAANTAYADFPRLSAIIARDRYLPRQFMNQGDRLAFSNGIIALSIFAVLLLVIFGGDTHALIPLYMIGVFVSFTLSQGGMVRHWLRLRTPGWRQSALINGIGATVTAVVLLVVAVTKANEGAWIILLLIPVLVVFFRMTHGHYSAVASQLKLTEAEPEPRRPQHGAGSGQRGAASRRARIGLRPNPGGRCPCVICRCGPHRDRAASARLGEVGTWRAASRAVVAVSVAAGTAARIHRTNRCGTVRRLRHRCAPRVRPGTMVAPPVSQSARAPYQGRTVVQAEHRGDKRPVSSGSIAPATAIICGLLRIRVELRLAPVSARTTGLDNGVRLRVLFKPDTPPNCGSNGEHEPHERWHHHQDPREAGKDDNQAHDRERAPTACASNCGRVHYPNHDHMNHR